MTIAGGATALLGFAIAFLFLLQPWRSCAEDDSPTGCVALPQDTAVMMVALIVALLGLLAYLLGRSERGWGQQDKPRAE
jgi:disulfide bond formation protein DsbB